MNRLLLRILWAQQSLWQFVIASLGFAFGLVVLLLSVQLLLNANSIMRESEDEGNFLILNKKVAEEDFITGQKKGFSKEEIELLQQQEWAVDAAPFTTNRFDVEASFQQFGLTSNVFFEAVPDKFVDTLPEKFSDWDSTQKYIPVIASIDLLNIYNFGIATAQNMRQYPESFVKGITVPVTVKGHGMEHTYQAQVVAFSERLPTIVVPQDFMDYANRKFGDTTKAPAKPARVILEVKDDSDPRIVSYLNENDYVTNTEQLSTDKLKTLINRGLSISIIIGMLFVVLAMVVFLTSFQLIVARAKSKLNVLFDLGYKRNRIVRLLGIQFLALLIALSLLAVVVIVLVYGKMSGEMLDRGIELTPKAGALALIMLMILVGLNALNLFSIKLALRK